MASNRKLIGFSLRKHPNLLAKLWTDYPCALLRTPSLRFAQPLTLKWEVWESVCSEELQAESNLTNLLYLPDTFGLQLADPTQCCLIAIDVSDRVFQENCEKYCLPELPAWLIEPSSCWRMIGYDVCTFGSMVEALYGYEWSSGIDELTEPYPIVDGNEFGLIVEVEAAEKMAEFFNQNVPEDAPFFAMGVWIKHRVDGKILVDL